MSTDPEDTYICGNVPRAGDLIEFGSTGTRMIVCRVIYRNDRTTILCGCDEYPLNLTKLISRYGKPDPTIYEFEKTFTTSFQETVKRFDNLSRSKKIDFWRTQKDYAERQIKLLIDEG
jgi:hypothetical protein